MTDHLKAIRLCDGGEQVTNGRTESLCSFCSNGRCVSWQACEVPEPEQQPEPVVRGLVQLLYLRTST